ncbi:hypothetical protein HDV02_001121 [Globomyces sp. JEL0801]|nr:hypothetical protein HDV02_001121 [Globomyces sp. JEL0801]
MVAFSRLFTNAQRIIFWRVVLPSNRLLNYRPGPSLFLRQPLVKNQPFRSLLSLNNIIHIAKPNYALQIPYLVDLFRQKLTSAEHQKQPVLKHNQQPIILVFEFINQNEYQINSALNDGRLDETHIRQIQLMADRQYENMMKISQVLKTLLNHNIHNVKVINQPTLQIKATIPSSVLKKFNFDVNQLIDNMNLKSSLYHIRQLSQHAVQEFLEVVENSWNQFNTLPGGIVERERNLKALNQFRVASASL